MKWSVQFRQMQVAYLDNRTAQKALQHSHAIDMPREMFLSTSLQQ